MNLFTDVLLFRPLGLAALLALTTGAAVNALALPSDRAEPISLEADEAERDDVKGTTRYSGNVVMQQGSMKINADQIVIYSEKDKVTQIVATGKPARYEQKPSADTAVVVAQANTLEYSLLDESLHLVEKAFLEQEGTSLSGSRIDYDVKKSVVKAGGETKNHERVRMIINPKVLDQDNKSSSEKPKS